MNEPKREITLELLVRVALTLKNEPAYENRVFSEMFTPAYALLSDWSKRLTKVNFRQAQIELVESYHDSEMVRFKEAIKAITKAKTIDSKLLKNFRFLVRLHDAELFHPLSPAEGWLESWEERDAVPKTFVERASKLYPDWKASLTSVERSAAGKKGIQAQKTT
jgi:hypothetical protein